MATHVVAGTNPDRSNPNAGHVVEPRNDDRRRELIALAAYYLAEHRGFQCGHEDEDWLAAEAQVDQAGITVSYQRE